MVHVQLCTVCELQIDRKTLFYLFSTGFLFFLRNNVCKKTLRFLHCSGFLCDSLLKEKQKNSIVFYQIFAYVISQK